MAILDIPKGDSTGSTAGSATALPRWDSWINAGSTSASGPAVFRMPQALRVVPSHSPDVLRRFVRRQSPKLRLSVLLGLVLIVTVTFTRINAPRRTPLNYFLSVVWSVYVPLCVLGVIGSIYVLKGRPRSEPIHAVPYARHRVPKRRCKVPRSSFNGHTDRLLIVTIPTLLAPGNLPALQRVLMSNLLNLPRYFSHFYIDVVTEGDVDDQAFQSWVDDLGELGRPVRIVNVPSGYSTPQGSRFKTRANHYAMEARRKAGENTQATYVYHLDDDTHIGPDTAASLAEFIERDGDRFLLAQGVLAFPHSLTPSRFCRLADSIRPADDLTRFAFYTGFLGTPLGGLHGEHLIVRADIEDEIGWDFPNTVIEDAYFAIQFAVRYPRRSTMLNSYSYGASPVSVRDLIRQRRRWMEGLLRLAFNRRLPLAPRIPLLYSIFTWSLAPLQFVGIALLVSFLTGTDNTSPVSTWIVPLWSFSLAYVFWLYIEGLKVNISASDRPRSFFWFAVLIIPALYVITVVETFASMLGIVRFIGIGRQRVSEVITKPI
jgi:beta-1,4-mannosyltransferase